MKKGEFFFVEFFLLPTPDFKPFFNKKNLAFN